MRAARRLGLAAAAALAVALAAGGCARGAAQRDEPVSRDAEPAPSPEGAGAGTPAPDTPVSHETTPGADTRPGCARTSADPDAPVLCDIAPDESDVRFHENPLAPRAGLPVLVTARPGMASVRPHRFSFAMPLRNGRLRLIFWGGVAPCFVLDRVDVREAPHTVTVTLFAGSDPASPNAACIEIATYMAIDVGLASPLARRVVLDGAEPEESNSLPILTD